MTPHIWFSNPGFASRFLEFAVGDGARNVMQAVAATDFEDEPSLVEAVGSTVAAVLIELAPVKLENPRLGADAEGVTTVRELPPGTTDDPEE